MGPFTLTRVPAIVTETLSGTAITWLPTRDIV